MALTNPQAASHIAGADGAFEPQRGNNFSVEIPLDGADRDMIVFALSAFTLPSQTNEQITINYQNQTRKVAGQANVDEGSLTLVDYVDQDVRGAILRWRKKVYDVTTGKIGKAADYKYNCNLIMTGPDGENTRVAKLVGCWPPSDPTIDLNMEGAEKVMMECPLSIDDIDWSGSVTGL